MCSMQGTPPCWCSLLLYYALPISVHMLPISVRVLPISVRVLPISVHVLPIGVHMLPAVHGAAAL